MKKSIAERRLCDPLLHRCPIGHRTFYCVNNDCQQARWIDLPDRPRRFVDDAHFTASGVCRNHPAAQEES